GIRFMVQTTLPSRLPFEVLDGICYVDTAAIDARLLERLVEHASRGADKRFALPILPVAGLLTHEHDLGMLGTLAKDGLGASLVEVTGAATGGRLTQRRQGQLMGSLTCCGAQLGGSGRIRSPHRVSRMRRFRLCADGPALWPGRDPARCQVRR